MTAHTHDDAFHEIQLNGKQLVFLVMAATVVSVAIFLCGVLVGRNVRAERSALVQAAEAAAMPTADVIPPPSASFPAVPSDVDPRSVAPPPPIDDTDAKRIDDAAEALKPAAPRGEVVAEAAPSTAVAATAKMQARQEKTSTATERVTAAPPSAANTPAPAAVAPGDGYAVQVAALNVRDEADAIAKRLSSKGYAAYVQVPTSGTAAVFRVRVGTFKTRREADSVAARLQKEERFKPWVTR